VLCVGVVNLTVEGAMMANCGVTVSIYLACCAKLTLCSNECIDFLLLFEQREKSSRRMDCMGK